jgi:lipopolysaccharide transport system permease protein
MFASIVREHNLVMQMVMREVMGRYRGSVLGIAWSFVNPLMMLAIYTFVFSTVFKARFAIDSDSKTAFALTLFVGLIIHSVIAESINRSPGLILGNRNYVKKVVFPLEIMPWVMMGSILFHTFVSTVVWMLFYLAINGYVHSTIITFPLILMPLVFVALGVSWFFASLGVYLRDIKNITGIISTILLFLSPIFYPAAILPDPYRSLIYLNPLTFIIEQSRDVMIMGEWPNIMNLLIAYVVGLLVALAGFAWFQKTRKGFADVL